jgi:hypothetical protein
MFHDIEHLHKDGQGFVYWKGSQVEHYSFNDIEQERLAAHRLAAKCRHLEGLGLVPSSSTAAWYYSWFEPLNPHSCYLDLLAALPGLYQSKDGELVFVSRWGTQAIHWHSERGARRVDNIDTTFATGEYSFAGLERRGYRMLQAGQPEHCGPCYADGLALSDLLAKHKVPLSLLDGFSKPAPSSASLDA